ncbi:MAG: hypothetical protein A2381_09305 [Bdellovibrionales bacterium RIFOXYB1_FULL_37_110]|nr:MAG: hypothetical protein A2417_14345 [Bdellovibrionales bacterium RIFOXYC1_FULL_37_79]OFZ56875.1 MAG: hypothetical protein A2381_09305 [Bdellovibrionales bacterium RIFOXYB1_FULL_37_110]OFZ65561.1 MAG: hypothetical protein A2577_17260 [Bdellovibrionales bacterium RIFOXYD1_FULL_36_51]
MSLSEIKNPNDAWIIHREEINTLQDGVCDIYVVLDVITGRCLEMETSKNLPSSSQILELIKKSCSQVNTTPQKIYILKKDPLAEVVQAVCSGLKIAFDVATQQALNPFISDFTNSFKQFKCGKNEFIDKNNDVSPEEIEAFIPDTYGPCPCASGKKYRFCCQKAFKDITYAMCEAQDGHLDKALYYMKQAEDKIGLTAEILCRYAISWSFFDSQKTQEFLAKALLANPNHPRTNYILGIESVEKKDYQSAITYYQKAIDHYPIEDKFHLNETYNNLGTAYYKLENYQMAKESWEKALVLLPSDKMVANNLFQCIYTNSAVPKELRTIRPGH